MRPGIELDHHLSLVLGWLPELGDQGLRYIPPRFWSHLEPLEVPLGFSTVDNAAIQLLTLLEVSTIDAELEYPFPPSTSFSCTVQPQGSQDTPVVAHHPTLPGAVALAVWLARDRIGSILHGRAISTALINAIPRTGAHAIATPTQAHDQSH